MKRGTVYYRDIPAGELVKDDFTRLLETSAYGAIGAVYVKA